MITDPRELFEIHVASILDHPSVYMGGPSQQSRRKAKAIADFIASGGTWATPALTPTESELRRNSDRAYVEAMVKAAYEDAAKIADKWRANIWAGPAPLIAEKIGAEIRARAAGGGE